MVPSDDDQSDPPLAFRLSWPGDPQVDDRLDPDLAPARSRPTELAGASPGDDSAVHGGSAPGPDEPSPRTRTETTSPPGQALTPLQTNAERVARLVVEAHDRLGGQVSGELRAMQADLDVDLAAMRSELASLRTSIGDVAERVQLRHLRSAIDELRSDVTALRRSVVEAPELEQVSGDVANLRSAMVDLLEQQVQLSRDLAATSQRLAEGDGRPGDSDLASLRNDVALIREQLDALAAAGARRMSEERLAVASMAPIIEELSALRDEVVALRRRTPVRSERSLTPADLERELDAAFERHSPTSRRRS